MIFIANIAQIPLVSSRNDTLSSPCMAQEKIVTCCVALVGQHGATRSSRQARLARHVFRGVATAWTGMDMSTSHFPEVVLEIDANTEHKKLQYCCSREHYCFFVVRHVGTSTARHAWQARHARHDARDTSRHARIVVSVGSWRVVRRRNKWNLGLTDYHVPRVRTKQGECMFSYSGPVAWNQLPQHIHSEQNFKHFKSVPKTFLFGQVFNVSRLCFFNICQSFTCS